MSIRLHANEIDTSEQVARSLLDAQFPRYANLPLKAMSKTGSTNRLYRLGEDLLLRLPRQPGGGKAIEKEARWLPPFGNLLSVQVPELVALGRPTEHFPESWAITRWIEGRLPSPPEDDPALAEQLADLVNTFRQAEVPEEALEDDQLRSYRGETLAAHDAQFRRDVQSCRELSGLDLDLDAVVATWEQALTVSASATRCWYHGDLVAENLLVENGQLVAVLDFGGLSVGDPCIDLHGAWELFAPEARQVFRRNIVGISEDEWRRARGWAVAVAVMTAAYYWDTLPGRVLHRLTMGRAAAAEGTA